MRTKYAAALICSLTLAFSALHDASAGEPKSRQVIVIPAHHGKVLWKDVWSEVAAQTGMEIPAPLPPSSGIDLNSTGARWTISGVNLLLSPEFELRIDNQRDCLLVTVNWESIDEPKRLLGKQLRQATSFADGLGTRLGLEYQPEAIGADRLVVLVHGFGSTPSALQGLRDRLDAEGHITGTFGYRSRHGVVDAAKQFSVALREMQPQSPDTKVTLVAHSMGGIVSRWMVEHAELYPSCVDQLIMIATPNHGTDWTQPGLTGPPLEYANLQLNPESLGKLAGEIAEEVHQGIRDLRPESKVLTHLNGLKRNAAVSYSIILGGQGAVQPALFLIPQTALAAHQEYQLAAMALSQLIYLQNQLGDEIIRGQGDGIVSVRSGLLTGVSDVIVLEMQHNDIRRPRKPIFENLVGEITKRIGK